MPNVGAEYSSTLAIGTYKVDAFTIDAEGLSSSRTAQLTFYVTASVQLDCTLLWDIATNVPVDVNLLWDVIANGQLDITLLWNIFVPSSLDVSLLWNTLPSWDSVVEEDSTTWELVTP